MTRTIALVAILVVGLLVGRGGLFSRLGSEATAGGGQSAQQAQTSGAADLADAEGLVSEDGCYTGKYEVAAYIHKFGHLPSNFVSKARAREAGWNPDSGNLDEVLPGKSIGGGRFYNDDGLLPDASNRSWIECDINYQGGFRGSERIVFSSDGLVYYTGDHYASFEQLY